MAYNNHPRGHQVISYGADHKKQLSLITLTVKSSTVPLEEDTNIVPTLSSHYNSNANGFMLSTKSSNPSYRVWELEKLLKSNLQYIRGEPPYHNPDVYIMMDTALYFSKCPNDLITQTIIINLYKKIHPYLPLIIPTFNSTLKKNYIMHTPQIPLKTIVNKMYNDYSPLPLSLVREYLNYPSTVKYLLLRVNDYKKPMTKLYPLLYLIQLYPQEVERAIKNNPELQEGNGIPNTNYLGNLKIGLSPQYNLNNIILSPIYYALYNQKSEGDFDKLASLFNDNYFTYEVYSPWLPAQSQRQKYKQKLELLDVPQLASNFVFTYLKLLKIDDMNHISAIHKADPTLITKEEMEKIQWFGKYLKLPSHTQVLNQEAINLLLKLKQDNLIEFYNKLLKTKHNNIHSHIPAYMLLAIFNAMFSTKEYSNNKYKAFYDLAKKLQQKRVK